MVPQVNQAADPTTSTSPPTTQDCHSTIPTRDKTSSGGTATINGMSLIRASLTGDGILPRAQEIILKSWREGTQKQYKVYLQKWISFCGRQHTDPLQPAVTTVIDFLTERFESGLGYSVMNTARCALSTFIVLERNISVGSHPLVKRFLKATYRTRPSLPRYQFMWDTSTVLTYLPNLPTLKYLDLKTITLKLVMLCALVTGQRCQSIHLMSLEHTGTGMFYSYFPS